MRRDGGYCKAAGNQTTSERIDSVEKVKVNTDSKDDEVIVGDERKQMHRILAQRRGETGGGASRTGARC